MSVNCLITGDKGFIGSHLKKALEVFYDVDVYEGDLINFKASKKYFYIYHIASNIKNQWSGDFKKEIEITKRLIKALDPKGRFYFASTFMVYGLSGVFHEASPFNPINPYAKVKLECENLIINSCKNYTIFRIGHVYGENATHGLIKIIKDSIENKKEMKLYHKGNDIMDFVYVKDVVNAILRCFQTGIYNIGSGESFQVKELVEYSGVKYKNSFDTESKHYKIIIDVSKMKTRYVPKQNVKSYIDTFKKVPESCKVVIRKENK